MKKDHLMSLKYLLILTVPIFIELLLQLVVGYSDQFMMKKYENAVNGITNANVINNMIINAFTVFSSAAIILITQYKGAKDETHERSVYSVAFYFNFIVSLFFSLIILGLGKTTKMETDNEVEVWHAMRATYRRELDAVHLLEKENLGCFVPMQYKVSIRKGKKVRTLVPVIRNLVFVHARPSDVQRVKSQITYLQYITDTRSGQKIIIPDHEMQRFIAVAGTYNDHLLYFQPEELNLSKGTRVRITGGDFAGQEGIFLKVKGAARRCGCRTAFSTPRRAPEMHHGRDHSGSAPLPCAASPRP